MMARDMQLRSRVLLVGGFRSIVPEGTDSPFGSQGGFVDTLAPEPMSLANAYLKTYAESFPDLAAAFDIELLVIAEPLELEDDREELEFSRMDLERIIERRPAILGFSLYCWNLGAVRRGLAAIRRALPDTVILLGGRGTEGSPEGLLDDIPEADIAVVGEGEIPFREILRLHRAAFGGDSWPRTLIEVPGVFFRDGDEVVAGAPPASLVDLDEIPSPYQQGLLHPPLHGVMLESSRGCLFACGYCTWNADKCLRHFSRARIRGDLAWVLANGHRHVTLNDAALNYDTEHLRAFVDVLGEIDPERRLHFTYNVRHDLLDAEQFDLLAKVPTQMVLLGVETFGTAAMTAVDRVPVDVEALHERLLRLGRVTRPPVASIVLGLPEDDERGFRRTLDTLMGWTTPRGDGVPAVGTVLVSLLQVYRGSSLWQQRAELELDFDPWGIPYLRSSRSWPAPALARAKAYLLRRMAETPDRLKAAEAIVLMETHRDGLDPWLAPRLVGRLLHPWTIGMMVEGWTLERIGVMRDTGQGVLIRFRHAEGGAARARLVRRGAEPRRRPGFSTVHYDVSARPLAGLVAAEEIRRLLVLLRSTLSAGEQRLAAHRGRPGR